MTNSPPVAGSGDVPVRAEAPDNSRKRSPRRSHRSWGLMATIRAAANSIARATPSSLEQISTTVAIVAASP